MIRPNLLDVAGQWVNRGRVEYNVSFQVKQWSRATVKRDNAGKNYQTWVPIWMLSYKILHSTASVS